MTVSGFLSRLEGVKRSGGGWIARCPAHDDHNPSLSIAEGKGQRIMVKCHAGCSYDNIIAALGLRPSDLFQQKAERRKGSPPSQDLTPEQKRGRWPRFENPTPLELHRIGELRNIGEDGLRLAVKRGLLRCADYKSERCWLVTDEARFNAQARRLDGQPFKHDGTDKKTLTLPGSKASWPVGLNEIEPFHNVMLVEGGPDLLAAHQFITVEECDVDCCAVAVLGASQLLSKSVLARFTGKHVRIFPHVDASGRKAAVEWARALLPVAAHVDVFSFDGLRRLDEQPVNDLNDLCSIHADDFETEKELWNLCPA